MEAGLRMTCPQLLYCGSASVDSAVRFGPIATKLQHDSGAAAKVQDIAVNKRPSLFQSNGTDELR